jgi:AcrR family transcriptional regulator
MPSAPGHEPATGLRERQRHALNALIYETSLTLFRSQGFEATTVQQIVSAAGIGKGTFFNHFPSKDCVLQEWYRRLTFSALETQTQGANESGRDNMIAVFTALTQGASSDAALFDAKTKALSSPQLRQEERRLDQELIAFCRNQIERDIAAGQLSRTANADFLSQMICSVLTGTAHSWALSDHQWELSETFLARLTLILDSVAVGARRK